MKPSAGIYSRLLFTRREQGFVALLKFSAVLFHDVSHVALAKVSVCVCMHKPERRGTSFSDVIQE